MEFLVDYASFLAKTVTLGVAIVIVLLGLASNLGVGGSNPSRRAKDRAGVRAWFAPGPTAPQRAARSPA